MRVLKIKARHENQPDHEEDTDDDGSESEDEQDNVTARYWICL